MTCIRLTVDLRLPRAGTAYLVGEEKRPRYEYSPACRMSKMQVDVLLVEDDPADVRLAKEALKRVAVPLRLNVLRDGVQALAFLHQEGLYVAAPRPDLILLDLGLPRKNGHEVLAEVKDDPLLCPIPVMVLTASPPAFDHGHSYDLYGNRYILKAPNLDYFAPISREIEDVWLHVASPPTPPAGRPAEVVSRPTILVIEDDPDIVLLLREALEINGYEVLAAVNNEALSLAREYRPAVVLLDLMMPGMDGGEISRRLRADPVTKHIPIVLMSAKFDSHGATTLLPVNECLPKPFSLNRLYATVAHWATTGVTKE